MSQKLSERAANALTGAGGLVISAAYVLTARGIEDSMLADEVGAAGVPVAVGALMALASAGLILKAAVTPPDPQATPAAEESEGEGPSAARAHALAFGLLMILLVYLLALPWLGYVVSIGLMAASVAWLSGGRQVGVLLGFALCTGPLLWALFDLALRIRLPAGIWRSFF